MVEDQGAVPAGGLADAVLAAVLGHAAAVLKPALEQAELALLQILGVPNVAAKGTEGGETAPASDGIVFRECTFCRDMAPVLGEEGETAGVICQSCASECGWLGVTPTVQFRVSGVPL